MAEAENQVAVTDEHLEAYEREGYVVVRGLLDPVLHIQPLLDEYSGVLDALVDKLCAGGRLESRHPELPFEQRLVQVYRETGEVFSQYFDFSLPQKDITRNTPFWFGPEVFNLLVSDVMLDAAERFVGPELYSTPVQHIRIKPPQKLLDGVTDNRVTLTPMHQDNGVLLPDADETNMLTVWFPLTEASVEMGCLEVRPRSHREALAPHCVLWNGLGIPDQALSGEDARPLPMSPGDVLFMHRLTAHGSMPNVSDRVRISFDLRYNPIGEPTGREVFPGFVARSRSNPSSEFRDPAAWLRMWEAARERLADEGERVFNRWNVDSEVCA